MIFVRASARRELILIFYLVKIKNSKDIFGSKKCKVTFGFKYILIKKKGGDIHISCKAEKEGYSDRTSVLYHI